MAEMTPEEIADQVNRDMDTWIRKQREAGLWPEISPSGQEHYAKLVAQALKAYGGHIRSETVEECACFVQMHPSYKAIDIANGLRALKDVK